VHGAVLLGMVHGPPCARRHVIGRDAQFLEPMALVPMAVVPRP